MGRRRALGMGGAVLASLSGAGALAACGAGDAAPTPDGARTKSPLTLTYVLHNTTKQEVDERHLPEYKEKNPHVTVEYALVPDAELPAKITSLFAAGSAPELFNPSSNPSTAMIDRGWTAEVDYKAIGLGSAQKLVDAYAWPTALDGWKWKGKYYGLPTEISNYCLYLNNRLFRKAGLDPQKDYPRDWDQMVEVARKLTVRDGGQIAQRGFEPDYGRPNYHWGGHAYQLIGQFFTEDGKVSINNEGAARTLQYWADWSQKHQLGRPRAAPPRQHLLRRAAGHVGQRLLVRARREAAQRGPLRGHDHQALPALEGQEARPRHPRLRLRHPRLRPGAEGRAGRGLAPGVVRLRLPRWSTSPRAACCSRRRTSWRAPPSRTSRTSPPLTSSWRT